MTELFFLVIYSQIVECYGDQEVLEGINTSTWQYP